jgi:thiamine pyrophosphate-dependent acetolactate synthase large subunit-like protein
MGAAVHSNVGLFNAAIAIFNAWCDRMPVMVIGATGPVDASKRRPWVDWIHTARDQGAIVRGYTKWDDQPASPLAAREALMRAAWIAETMPMGPVYVNLDAGMQEMRLAAQLVSRYPDRRRADASDRIARELSFRRRPNFVHVASSSEAQDSAGT